MKTLIITICTLIAAAAVAQPKYTSVYSARNYKMPLHAKVAKENNLDKTQTFEHNTETATGGQSSANYKNTFSKANDNGGQMPILPIDITVNPMASGSNYKSNFKGTTRKSKTEEVPVQQPVVSIPVEKDTNQ